MRGFVAALQDLLFPPCCLGCGRQLPARQLPLFCSSCFTRLSPLSSPCCSCCGIPFVSGQDHLCGRCLKEPPGFDLARGALIYHEPLVTLIRCFKYGGELAGLSSMAWLASQSVGYREIGDPDIILPVPLHPTRLRERGFNQSLLLARSFFPGLRDRIAPDLLLRTRPTIPQSTLSGSARRRNLQGAFAVADGDWLRGRHVLLVDDVMTTGSTIGQCARVLRRAGCRRIEVFVLAMAVPD